MQPQRTPHQENQLPPLVNQNPIIHSERQLIENELKLISVSQGTGHIADIGTGYTLSLTMQINKPVDTLTVAKLLAFHRECCKRFNEGGQS